MKMVPPFSDAAYMTRSVLKLGYQESPDIMHILKCIMSGCVPIYASATYNHQQTYRVMAHV